MAVAVPAIVAVFGIVAIIVTRRLRSWRPWSSGTFGGVFCCAYGVITILNLSLQHIDYLPRGGPGYGPRSGLWEMIAYAFLLAALACWGFAAVQADDAEFSLASLKKPFAYLALAGLAVAIVFVLPETFG